MCTKDTYLQGMPRRVFSVTKQGKPLVTCGYRLMPANGTNFPIYHLKCIVPKPQGNGTAKEKEAPTSTFNNFILHIKIIVHGSEPMYII